MGRVITIVTLGACLVASGVPASHAGAEHPASVRLVGARIASEHPVPIPHVQPAKPGPIPIPHVDPVEPGPVPMPHLLVPDGGRWKTQGRLLVPRLLEKK
jgi:hypothetical protein